ncbi:MAG: 4-hydroxy-tetrahydrodipicolinate synthase [Bacillota bacterium]
MNFGSVITAMVTPFFPDGQVNFEKAQKLACYLTENGSDGIVVAGTTGESCTLSIKEKLQLFTAVKDAVGKKCNVLVGTGSNDTLASAELTKKASKLGVDGLLLVAPYYNKPPQEGLYSHYKALAESTDLPVMLYNVPSRTGINILPETVERLAKITNIVAIKEAYGSMDQISDLRKRLGDKFAIYSGDDSLTLPTLSLGGRGVVSVVSHLVGKQIKNMIDAFYSGQYNQALDIHLKLFSIFKAMFITTNPIPIKTALNLLGWNLGGFRLPLTAPSEKENAYIDKVLKEYQLKN